MIKSLILIYSVIYTASANDLRLLYYLKYVFEQLQLNKNLEMAKLLPYLENIPETRKV